MFLFCISAFWFLNEILSHSVPPEPFFFEVNELYKLLRFVKNKNYYLC